MGANRRTPQRAYGESGAHDCHLMKVELKADLVGTVAKVDDDGDALINFPALGSHLIDTTCWISRANFDDLLQLSAANNGWRTVCMRSCCS